MSHKLINLNPDLKQLRDEGHELEIKGAFLLVHHIPYVNAQRQIAYGTLVTSLTLAGEKTVRPNDHVIHFIGEHPCNRDGSRISAIQHQSSRQVLDPKHNIVTDHSFSNKPANGFANYYEKVTSYARVIASQAQAIDEKVTAKTFRAIATTEDEAVFHYLDTNSSRAEITPITAKLEKQVVAIIGLGGTGAYVLDFVAKTPVAQIHLFDGDFFYSHNAFRSPGAASLQELETQHKKVAYLHATYSKMHKRIFPHGDYVTQVNLGALDGMTFAFLCVDDGEAKKVIIAALQQFKIPFVDVGIGVQVVDQALTGSVRTTVVTSEKQDHVAKHISFADGAENDYSKNIQIAELNALNAALAVIKWKKWSRFYHDLEKEHHSIYDINVNKLHNEEAVA